MDNLIYAIIGAGLGVLAIMLLRRREDKSGGEGLMLIQNQINEVVKTIDRKLSETYKITRDVTEELTSLKETNKQVIVFTDQLKNLQDILKNPKQRGVLGEYYLETLLKNVLPTGSFQMQYPFPDGTIVDAVVFVKDKIIPIDSKFSLENYNRLVEEEDLTEKSRLEKSFVNDLKNRIVETSKYVQPAQGTTDFAFMFIPHEAIYYDLLINKIGGVKGETDNLIQRAVGKYHVIIVSPTSFLAYLQTVLQGLRALQIEESAKEIRKRIEELGRHIINYNQFMTSLGNTLGTTVNHYNNAYKEFKKIDKDIFKITDSGGEVEILTLDKPKID